MAISEVALRLCLGEHAVPVERASLPFIDPYKLTTMSDEFIVASLVSFKATGTKVWLEQGLHLPSKWWLQNHANLPILQEILELIRKQKPRTGGQSRLPRNQKSLIALKVRGKVLWFQNDSRCVILGVLDGDEGLAAFRWFLEELSKDSKDPGGSAAAGGAGEPAESEPNDRGPGELGTFVAGALQVLHSNPRCLHATFLPSRVSIRVVRKEDKAVSLFRVKRLKRKRAEASEHDSQEPVKRQFDLVVSEALKFLDSDEHADNAVSELPGAPMRPLRPHAGLEASPEGPASA